MCLYLKEVTVLAGQNVFTYIDDNSTLIIDNPQTRDFRPAAYASPDALFKYHIDYYLDY
jgi:hypothetical protein